MCAHSVYACVLVRTCLYVYDSVCKLLARLTVGDMSTHLYVAKLSGQQSSYLQVFTSSGCIYLEIRGRLLSPSCHSQLKVELVIIDCLIWPLAASKHINRCCLFAQIYRHMSQRFLVVTQNKQCFSPSTSPHWSHICPAVCVWNNEWSLK